MCNNANTYFCILHVQICDIQYSKLIVKQHEENIHAKALQNDLGLEKSLNSSLDSDPLKLLNVFGRGNKPINLLLLVWDAAFLPLFQTQLIQITKKFNTEYRDILTKKIKSATRIAN